MTSSLMQIKLISWGTPFFPSLKGPKKFVKIRPGLACESVKIYKMNNGIKWNTITPNSHIT